MKDDAQLSKTLKVVEIFHSLQGEGANTGRSAVFVRLSDCNLNCSFCDTDWSRGTEMTVQEVLNEVIRLSGKTKCSNMLLIWTGGEPTLQLTSEMLKHFSGFYNCIETNGTNPVPAGIDYISCSPKIKPAILRKNFKSVNEFRYPVEMGSIMPAISELPPADNYYVSPLFSGEKSIKQQLNSENLNFAIDWVKNNPEWRLSVQMHKFLHIP